VGNRRGILRTTCGGDAVACWILAPAVFTVPFGVAHVGGELLAAAVLLARLAAAVLPSALPYTLEMIALARLPRRVFGGRTRRLRRAGRARAPRWLAIALVILASFGSAWSADKQARRQLLDELAGDELDLVSTDCPILRL
jgi:inner membrane transporter RhtA